MPYLYYIIGFSAVLITLVYLFPLVLVDGISMFPTYKDKEIVLSSRFYKIKQGDVYVYKTPTNEVVIKRLSHSRGNKLFFLGDNRENSLDSRYYGTVPESYIISKVIFCRKREEQ